jgi:hypothetical protein
MLDEYQDEAFTFRTRSLIEVYKDKTVANCFFPLHKGTHQEPSLREKRRVPTARPCADGQMSGPSAQKRSSTGDGAARRRTVTVGTPRATPTVTVGAKWTVGTGS